MQRSMWNIVRHILLHFKNARHWEEMLERYRNVDERLRLYDIDNHYEQFTKRTISIEAKREDRQRQGRPLENGSRTRNLL